MRNENLHKDLGVNNVIKKYAQSHEQRLVNRENSNELNHSNWFRRQEFVREYMSNRCTIVLQTEDVCALCFLM